MELFTPPGQEIIKKIKSLDISVMTPIEALNFLDDLQVEAGGQNTRGQNHRNVNN